MLIRSRVCCFQFVCSSYKSLPKVNKPSNIPSKFPCRQRASLSNHFNKVFNLHEQISLCSWTLAYIFETLPHTSSIFYNKLDLLDICSWERSFNVGSELLWTGAWQNKQNYTCARSDRYFNLKVMLKFYKFHGHVSLISRSTTIATKSCVCPAETQISMRSALVQFDQSLLGALWVAKDPQFLLVYNEDWSECAGVQTDLSLRWALMRCCRFIVLGLK